MPAICQKKNISITHEIVENIQIYGDQTLLIRLWMNLLNNALQYGKENGHIHVSLTSHDGYIYGSVEDDGCGIHEKTFHIYGIVSIRQIVPDQIVKAVD